MQVFPFIAVKKDALFSGDGELLTIISLRNAVLGPPTLHILSLRATGLKVLAVRLVFLLRLKVF